MPSSKPYIVPVDSEAIPPLFAQIKALSLLGEGLINGLDHGVALQLTQPGKPTQNAYIESFNGKFRGECLNENWFMTVTHAKAVISIWRTDYNECRPHGSLAKQTPTEFTTHLRLTGDIFTVEPSFRQAL